MDKKDQDRSKEKLSKLLLVSYNMRRSSYIVRALAGGYLVYLMYQLFSQSAESGEALSGLMTAAGASMMVAGIYFAISAVYALVNGIYEENDPAKLAELEAEFPQAESEPAETEEVVSAAEAETEV